MAQPWLGRQGGSEGKDCGGSAAVQAWGQRGVRTMTAAVLDPYRVEAFNTAKASENKIHDDAVARRFGFGGGLVPGGDVYAYMAHQPVARWGRAWLERGAAECRFKAGLRWRHRHSDCCGGGGRARYSGREPRRDLCHRSSLVTRSCTATRAFRRAAAASFRP